MPRLIDAHEAEEHILTAMKNLCGIDNGHIRTMVRVGLDDTKEWKDLAPVRCGHWKLYVNNGGIEVLCSECEHGNEVLGDDQYESLCCFATRYCPECGAYMSTDPIMFTNNDNNELDVDDNEQ